MRSVRVTGIIAACIALAAANFAAAREASEVETPPPQVVKKRKDILDVLVPIPSASSDVGDNGCRVRSSPKETFTEADADLGHVAFETLIAEVIGRYSVRAIVDPPAKFIASLGEFDADMRTLVMLDVLRDGLGRDGLHTFFFMSGAEHAPTIRDALQAAGMTREHGLFARAMALFGPTYPLEEEARAKRFSYSSLDTPLNDFDRQMLDIAAQFGAREDFDRALVAYVERVPALWQKIEAKRARLGEIARLRYLLTAIAQRTRTWDTPDADAGTRLAAVPKEQRTLLVMNVFNAEFENGGVHQFFLNSSGALAPEVYDAFIELGLERQAAIYKRGLDMFGAKYARDTERRRERYFDHGEWTDWDKKLSALTDEFYDLDGGPTVVRINGGAVAGGPGIWPAMAVYARNKKLLPC